MKKIIQQGAEAKIILNKKEKSIIKNRVSKSYRHTELDKKIRKRRTKAETKLLKKSSNIIRVPVPEFSQKFDEIIMPYIKGKKLSENLDEFSEKGQKKICREIGKSIALLHKKEIIHGDLTTSNMILKGKKLYFIDFGLGYISKKIEDKAVDLHLLKQAFEAKHFKNYQKNSREIFKEYEKTFGKTKSKKIIERIKTIEKRGRYRH